MKRVLFFLLLGLVTLLGAQNLIVNSSFESIDPEKEIPQNWSIVKRGIFEDAHSFNTAISLDGKTSAQITNNSGLTKGVSLYYMQNLGTKFNAISANTKIVFSGFARAITGTAKARVYFESLKGKKLVLKDFEVFDDRWTNFSLSFTKEDLDYGLPYICLGLLNGEGILFDSIYLGKENANLYDKFNTVENLIFNGNFENVKNAMPIKWQVLNKTKGVAQLVKTSDGGNCINLSSKDKVKGLLMWTQRIDASYFKNLASNTEIEIKLKAKTDNDKTVFRFYTEFTAGKKFIGTFIAHNQKSTNTFQEKKFTFKVPAIKPTGVNFYLQLMSSGEVWFDDISMKIKK